MGALFSTRWSRAQENVEPPPLHFVPHRSRHTNHSSPGGDQTPSSGERVLCL